MASPLASFSVPCVYVETVEGTSQLKVVSWATGGTHVWQLYLWLQRKLRMTPPSFAPLLRRYRCNGDTMQETALDDYEAACEDVLQPGDMVRCALAMDGPRRDVSFASSNGVVWVPHGKALYDVKAEAVGAGGLKEDGPDVCGLLAATLRFVQEGGSQQSAAHLLVDRVVPLWDSHYVHTWGVDVAFAVLRLANAIDWGSAPVHSVGKHGLAGVLSAVAAALLVAPCAGGCSESCPRGPAVAHALSAAEVTGLMDGLTVSSEERDAFPFSAVPTLLLSDDVARAVRANPRAMEVAACLLAAYAPLAVSIAVRRCRSPHVHARMMLHYLVGTAAEEAAAAQLETYTDIIAAWLPQPSAMMADDATTSRQALVAAFYLARVAPSRLPPIDATHGWATEVAPLLAKTAPLRVQFMTAQAVFAHCVTDTLLPLPCAWLHAATTPAALADALETLCTLAIMPLSRGKRERTAVALCRAAQPDAMEQLTAMLRAYTQSTEHAVPPAWWPRLWSLSERWMLEALLPDETPLDRAELARAACCGTYTFLFTYDGEASIAWAAPEYARTAADDGSGSGVMDSVMLSPLEPGTLCVGFLPCCHFLPASTVADAAISSSAPIGQCLYCRSGPRTATAAAAAAAASRAGQMGAAQVVRMLHRVQPPPPRAAAATTNGARPPSGDMPILQAPAADAILRVENAQPAARTGGETADLVLRTASRLSNAVDGSSHVGGMFQSVLRMAVDSADVRAALHAALDGGTEGASTATPYMDIIRRIAEPVSRMVDLVMDQPVGGAARREMATELEME